MSAAYALLADRAERADVLLMENRGEGVPQPHFLDDFYDALDMHQGQPDEDEGELEEGDLATVTDIAAFVANVNSKMGGGE